MSAIKFLEQSLQTHFYRSILSKVDGQVRLAICRLIYVSRAEFDLLHQVPLALNGM